MNIISFKNVHFTYPGDDQESLCGIDLDIAAGSFVAVLGTTAPANRRLQSI